MLVEQVRQRIAAQVPALAGRCEGAAELAALVRKDELPQETPAAYVVPLGLDGREADALANAYTQMTDEVVSVVIVLESADDPKGQRALPTIDALVTSVVAAVAGWGPAAAIGVFRLLKGRMVSVSRGTIVYQIDFGISDQLRIIA